MLKTTLPFLSWISSACCWVVAIAYTKHARCSSGISVVLVFVCFFQTYFCPSNTFKPQQVAYVIATEGIGVGKKCIISWHPKYMEAKLYFLLFPWMIDTKSGYHWNIRNNKNTAQSGTRLMEAWSSSKCQSRSGVCDLIWGVKLICFLETKKQKKETDAFLKLIQTHSLLMGEADPSEMQFHRWTRKQQRCCILPLGTGHSWATRPLYLTFAVVLELLGFLWQRWVISLPEYKPLLTDVAL